MSETPDSDRRQTIWLIGEVGETMCNRFVQAMSAIEMQQNMQLTIALTTSGGNTMYSRALQAGIGYIAKKVDVRIVAVEHVKSSGLDILLAAPVHRRFATPGTRFLFHGNQYTMDLKLTGGGRGVLTEIDRMRARVLEDELDHERTMRQLAQETNLSYKKLNKLTQKGTNWYFGTKKALKIRLISDVIDHL